MPIISVGKSTAYLLRYERQYNLLRYERVLVFCFIVLIVIDVVVVWKKRDEERQRKEGIMISTECVNENEDQIQISPFFHILNKRFYGLKSLPEARKGWVAWTRCFSYLWKGCPNNLGIK